MASPTIRAVSGGLATIAGTVVIGLALPAFAAYRHRSEAHEVPPAEAVVAASA